MIRGLCVRLCSLNTKFPRFIYVLACICAPFPFTAACCSIVWLYSTLFVCSSPDGHLKCFHLFATIYSTATHIRIKFFGLVEHLFSVILDIYLGVEMLGHVVILCLTFLEHTLIFIYADIGYSSESYWIGFIMQLQTLFTHDVLG